MSDLQAAVDRMLCGEHGWAPLPGNVIVGFKIIETVWEGKPNLDGWDNVAERREVAHFARFEDAAAFEEEGWYHGGKYCSYEILPIEVQCPSQRIASPPEQGIGKPLRAIEIDIEDAACPVA